MADTPDLTTPQHTIRLPVSITNTDILDADGAEIISTISGRYTWAEDQARAALIARAVNAHDALVAALRVAREFIDNERYHLLQSFCSCDAEGEPDLSTLGDDGRPLVAACDTTLAQIDAALALAEGRDA